MYPEKANAGDRFDVAIIGSGIGGSTLAAILARHGVRVVVFEAKSHPRFAIGESMILETSETMRALAELYDVPEVAYFSSENYFDLIGSSHGVKRHFSFLHHLPGSPQDRRHSLQAVIPKQPHGHELHLYRQDVDAYLTTVAVAYGATVLQNTPVQDIELYPDRVEVITARGDRYPAAYVVDAGGYKSILADRFDLRDRDMHTHSRGLFTHMVGVPDFHAVSASRKAYGLPFSVAEGTLHHVFEGGWMWVIPFNNHPRATNPLCSVGLMLDERVYPTSPDLGPDAEFFSFIERFPSLAAQFRSARAVRDWTRAGRISYSSKQVVGDRFCLLGHAAGFVDPLYSKGLYTTMMSVSVLADLLLDARRDGDYSADRFRPLESMTLAYIRTADRLVANSYKSWANYSLWVVYSVLWLLGAYTEYVKLTSMRARLRDRRAYYAEAHTLRLAGGGFPEFDAVAALVDLIIEQVDAHDEAAVDQAVAEICRIYHALDWMPEPFLALLEGKNHLPKNKLRLSLLRREGGFLGSGAYRRHFFGNGSVVDLAAAFVREKVNYSSVVLRRKHRPGMVHAPGA